MDEKVYSKSVLVSLTVDDVAKMAQMAASIPAWIEAGVGIESVHLFVSKKRGEKIGHFLFIRNPDTYKEKAGDSWWRDNVIFSIRGKGGKVYGVVDDALVPDDFVEYHKP